MKKIKILLIALGLVSLLVAPGLVKAGDVLMMATTTSTDNTGLLDELAPVFKKDTGIELRWVAKGTGAALKMADNCDVDVVMVHAPASEQKYVDMGVLKDRKEIMYNDFVIIGPDSDPAGVKGMPVVQAMKTIAAKKAVFVSRGDNSGTNKKEISLWKVAGMSVPDKEAWYVQSGQNMIKSIVIAEERGGYTMTDRGTYIKYSATKNGSPELNVLVEGDKTLFNQYSVLAVNPAHCPKANYKLATKFADWIVAPETQKAIADFKLLGKKLFTPNAK
ncbi:substrate-binding domain-containing protein [Maridesulfovibrio hydrothermalis]|uniref:ABC transporter, periplasmic substrate-binding protein n=1 Tax=Maridesulfovibrio hydrothermalis AM13 = DSM 14728 TaxID=1121451 RepID=L0RGK9_9BACT|nr:substrate-binding domain-containing protein [Maridesulfovibrio hydrothermalis]CCO25367.1 ABC transporter, periplasmic substrate-binding protein [Maridesulfovibrio hydrothermalis AM13 = DSM 14728]